jgi:tRNA nucleotidyltransferase (CCA-adding enzyme)
MSDYMFMLENHLTAAQNRVLAEVRKAALEANVNVFLTGGAVRDMLGGFPIRDLDFTVEGNAIKLAKTVADQLGAEILETDSTRKSVELLSPEGVTFEIGMARTERYAKTAGKPQVTAATIQEDLQRRDLTINALALSLNRGSRGLLLDPTNGMGDLERKELRNTGNYVFYDSPVRLLRLGRFRARLGFTIAEKTELHYRNAREAEIEKFITREELLHEFRQAALEPNVAELLQAWDEEKLLKLVSPALTGAALNLASFTKLQKFRQSLPFGIDMVTDEPALFFSILTEKLSPKERAVIAELDADNSASWLKLGARASKLEKEVSASNLHRPSKIYNVLAKAPGEQILYLIVHSQQRPVQDRIRNYLQKYIPAAQEITDLQVIEAGYTVGTPKFDKAKAEMIAKRLDARPPKKPETDAETEAEIA